VNEIACLYVGFLRALLCVSRLVVSNAAGYALVAVAIVFLCSCFASVMMVNGYSFSSDVACSLAHHQCWWAKNASRTQRTARIAFSRSTSLLFSSSSLFIDVAYISIKPQTSGIQTRNCIAASCLQTRAFAFAAALTASPS
jgi:hypothetical protein